MAGPGRHKVPLLRTSERLTYKSCLQKWHWNFNDRLKPVQPSPALRFGDLVHRALAPYYKKGRKRGPHPAKTFEKLYHADLKAELTRLRIKTPEDAWLDALELGIGMLKGYVEKYKDADSEYEVISSEQTFEVLIRDKDGRPLTIYVGTVDGVWRKLSDRTLWFKEFKTTGKGVDDLFRGLPMDEQAGGYWTFAPEALRDIGVLKPKDKLEGVLYTALRKSIPNPDWVFDEYGQKLNQDGSVSKVQPAKNFGRIPVFRDRADMEIMRERVIAEATEMAYRRAGKLAVYKNPGPLFMPNCRNCDFQEMCELHESGQDWEAMRDGMMTTWDPYSAHERVERM